MNKHKTSRTEAVGRLLGCSVAALVFVVSPLRAAQTDISSTPITSTNSAQVKPNIMLLMDTSDSMSFSHMPDEVEAVLGPISTTDVAARVGYKSSQCNVLYYNPSTTYVLPKRADGSFFPTPSFNSAPYDAYDTLSSVTVNLASGFTPYDDSTLRHGGWTYPLTPAYYYAHTGPAIANYTAGACADLDVGSTQPASDGGTWTRVDVSAASGAQQANFAIWYTYYRTRIAMIKSAASLAFTPLTDSFRVGLITVNPKFPNNVPLSADSLNAPINPDKYLRIADFDSTQRNLWFDKLFSQKTGGTSPAREGLARVGRHYAGKHDGINTGMPEDPVQYSCQQNFTIMTTDGYWNDNAETVGAGPVQIDGVTKVGQQDGNLDAMTTNTDAGIVNVNGTPRPIWDGVPDGKRVRTNKSNAYRYSPCGVYFNKTDTQLNRSTSQVTIATSQTTQSTLQSLQSTTQMRITSLQSLQSSTQMQLSTVQNLQSTNQNRQSTNQNLQSTTQTQRSTVQNRQSTNQNLQSTTQNVQNTSQTIDYRWYNERTIVVNRQSTTQTTLSTSQTVQSTSQTRKATTQNLQSTTQTRQTTTQNLQTTAQITRSTSQNLKSTVQNLTSTSQNRQSTSQVTRSTQQTLTSTFQELQSTSQTTLSTSQVRKSTSQTSICADTGETCNSVPTGTCVPGGGFHCETVTTGPTLVASCTPASASIANNYVQTTCAVTGTGPTAVLSCTPATASAGNSYTTTTCNTVTTSTVPVDICNSSPASSGNNYTATTCSSLSTGPTATASCTPIAASAGNSWTQTSCTFPTTGPTAVSSCTPVSASSGNSWTATTCNTVTTTNVPVASCTASGPTSGNNWTTTTCSPLVTTNVPTATCSAASATAGNAWTTTTCSTNNTTNVAVASCSPSAATSGNSWTTTTCPPPATTGPTGVSSCTSSSASSGNSWTTTTCGTNNQSNVPVLSCTASGPTSGNGYTTTTCPAPVVTGPVGVQNCVAAGATALNAWTATTCTPNNSTNVPVLSCTATIASSGNNWTATTCPAPITTGPTPISSCTPVAATSGNSWTATTCPTLVATNVPVSSCTASGPTSGNSWTTTTCPAPITTGPTGVSSCAASGPTSGNSWTTTTCGTNNTTNVAVSTCTASSGNTGNNWTTTTCPAATVVSGPTAVQTCTPVTGNAGNGYQTTLCAIRSTTMPSGTCVPSGPTLANGWVTTECNVVVGTSVPVLTCTPQTGNAGNNWVTITCPAPIVTTNVPVATCTPAAPLIGNNYTTVTCPAPVVTTNVPVATCTAAAASAGNSWTTTTCPAPITTGPTGVASCTGSSASAGNSWTTTTCTPNNTTNVPVLSCTASGPTAGNAFTTTTCPAPNVTTNVAVVSCTAAAASAGNSWTTTTCPAPIVTTNVPVSACSPAAPTAGNGFTTFTCPTPITTGPTFVSSCTPAAASAGNSWTATICTPNNTANVPVASCTPQTASAGNGWQGITCSTNNVIDQPAANCTPQAPTAGNAYTTITCNLVTTTNVPVSSCSASTGGPGNNFVTTTCTLNNTTNVPVASCTPVAPTAGNGYTTTTCPVINTGPLGATSCTPSGPSAGNNYVTTTCTNATTGPTPVGSCVPVTATSGNGWTATTCNTITTGPTLDTVCTIANPSAANNFTRTLCEPVSGSKIQFTTTTTEDTTFYSGGVPSGALPTITTVTPLADVDGVCYAPNVTPPALPIPNPQPPMWTAADATAFPSCSAWPCDVTSALSGARSVNSLADVAQYYYITDLRQDADWPTTISTNDVPSVGSGNEDDRVRWQHMTTFTIALGVSGTLNYRPDYKSGSVVTGDFAGIRNGSQNWPLWPDPLLETSLPDNYGNRKSLWDNPKSIDDFWHTAVNGRGTYFSAANPTSVIAGLADALAGIQARLASGSAAATSNLEPVSGDNLIYLASYTTQKWTGDVQAKEIDLATGAINPTIVWSAQAQLDARTRNACDDRNIYLFRQGATNNLTNFTWNTSTCDASGNPAALLPDGLNATEQANFGTLNVSLLSQYPSMTDGTVPTVDQRTPATGANLVNFLRGQRGFEGFVTNDVTKLFRSREHVLGDTVNGQPTYVRAPFSLYGDAGYAAFKSANSSRIPMLYVPGNDGMLHAFYAGTSTADPLGGKEAWAVIPSTVLPKLYKLADNNYKDNHLFFVDGTPSVSDVFDTGSGTWKTILVAGLNNGGKGYYALDVTNPLSPKGLWEFKWSSTVCPWSAGNTPIGAAVGNTSDCHLGQTYGRPLITKLADGTWVVMVTSGYNNVNAPVQAGDGGGYLYVLNASTGQIVHKIPTGVGNPATPSGLAQINGFADLAEINNMTLRVYGTDVLGNIWRFDVNDNLNPSGREATLLGTAKDSGGTPQPITIRPELSVKDGNPMVFVGTGRFLGATDVGDLQTQSIYGIVDPMSGSPSFANLRSALVPLTLTQVGSGAGTYRTVACAGTVAQCAAPDGWVVNLPDSGERVNVEMKLRSGTLIVGSNVPQISACVSGGYSWLNYFNYRDGTALPGGTAGGTGLGQQFSVSQQFSNFLIVGITIVKLPGIGSKPKVYVTGSNSTIEAVDLKFAPGDDPKRVSWREISAP
jgi:Tfp pilus tip-associated adhesin PilY1